MLLLTYPYNTNYRGPALPVVDARAINLDDPSLFADVVALIDSGSDASRIPLKILRKIDAVFIDRKRVVDLSGISIERHFYEVSIGLGPFVVPKLEVIASKNSEEAILGRDVLNYFVVTLNGLSLMTEISQ